MTSSSVFELTGLSPRAGASRSDIDEVERALGIRLPDDYRSFLLQSDGLEGPVGEAGYLMLWSTSSIAELNTAMETREFAPGLILIGTDGGDTGYGFLESRGRTQYVQVPLIGMSLAAADAMATTLSQFLERITTQA